MHVFLRKARLAKRLVDEANEITHAVRPQDGFVFEIAAMAPLLAHGYEPLDLPALGVRLVRKLSKATRHWRHAFEKEKMRIHGFRGVVQQVDSTSWPLGNSDIEECALISFKRFEGHLQMMRDVYETWASDRDAFEMDPEVDPWINLCL